MNGGDRRAVALTARVPAAAIGLTVAYLSVLTAAAWIARASGRGRTPLPPSPRHRFSVLIPAHNEERLIGGTLKSLAELDYPAELVDVHVVADHCTDDTVGVVRDHGVTVHEHVDPDPAGKGPALQWLLGRLSVRDELGDAVVFIDADTTVSRDFLRIVDAHLAAGAKVVQSHYAVRDPERSPAIAFRAAALAARHYLRPLGRTRLGGSAGLYGNGMVFRAEALHGRRWSDHLTEDIELHLELLLDGTRVTFAADAVVEAEMPATIKASRTQHERWERGRVQVARRFVPRLLGRTVSGGPAGRFAYADAAVEQLIPPFSVVVVATAALGLASVARAWWSPTRAGRRAVVFAAGLTGALVAYLISALRMVDAPASVYRSLIRAPLFVAWKVGLWVKVLARPRDVGWIRTARNNEAGGS